MNRSLGGIGPLLGPAILFAFFILLASHGVGLPSFLTEPFLYQGKPVASYVIDVGLWFSGAWVLLKLVNGFVWDGAVSRAIGGRVPGLVKTISALVIASIAVTGVVGVVFGLPITGFFATSGVVGIVVGFALRNTINDVFTGVALNVDRGFKIGDWVTVHARERDIVGEVSEIDWRTTRISCEDNTVVILPNGSLGQMVVTNHWGRGREVRLDVHFSLDPGVQPDRARRVFLGAVRAVTDSKGILAKPEPEVLVAGTSDAGVDYLIRYWMKPWEPSAPSSARDVVVRSILSHLRQAGISPSYPKEEVFLSRSSPRSLDSSDVADREGLLARIPLFRDLSEEELRSLAGAMRQRAFNHGAELYRQGEPGSSMFVVVEGVLASSVQSRDGNAQQRAAQFVPGDFVGEFSLLTGDTREATVTAMNDSVVFEITKVDLDALCVRRPELVEILATALVDRMVNISEVVERGEGTESAEQGRGLAWNLVRRVKNTFQAAFNRSGAPSLPRAPVTPDPPGNH